MRTPGPHGARPTRLCLAPSAYMGAEKALLGDDGLPELVLSGSRPGRRSGVPFLRRALAVSPSAPLPYSSLLRKMMSKTSVPVARGQHTVSA